MKKILVLGGYGQTATCLGRLLRENTDAEIVIAGRNLQKAETLKAVLAQTYASTRVGVACADVEDPKSVRSLLPGIDLVLLATSFGRHGATVSIRRRRSSTSAASGRKEQ